MEHKGIPIFIAAACAGLLIGGIALHDRSEAIAYGDHGRVIRDDAVIANVSLPTGAMLLVMDSQQ